MLSHTDDVLINSRDVRIIITLPRALHVLSFEFTLWDHDLFQYDLLCVVAKPNAYQSLESLEYAPQCLLTGFANLQVGTH